MRNPSFERPVRTIVRLASNVEVYILNAMSRQDYMHAPKAMPGLIRYLGTLPKPVLHRIIRKLEK